MDDERIDQIFRDKIGGLSQTPTEEAWQKIDGGLHGKRKKAIWLWLKAAMVALVCIAAGYLVYQATGDQDKPKLSVVEMQRENPVTEGHTVISPQKEDTPLIAKEQKGKANMDKASTEQNDNSKSREKIKGDREPEIKPEAATQTETSGSDSQEVPESETKSIDPLKTISPSTNPDLVAQQSTNKAEQKGKKEEKKLVITIIYKSGGDSKPSLVAESEERSTLEKIMVKAQEIKQSDLSLAALRKAKDDLFALDFKSED